MREVWVATSNAGKLKEFRNLLIPHNIQVKSNLDVPNYASPPELGSTFTDNARIKAKSLHAVKSSAWVLADDSGLEVEGLGGLPGIHSARYAGPKARDSENVAKLLKMMQIRSPKNRQARFVCVLVLISPEGKEHIIEGLVEGNISEKAQGQGGFGYDPVFIPKGETKSFAELDSGVKNKISHRAQAFRKLLEVLK
ncbi:MAG: RdgB/HAM1 family non-canonical purine NTP pyrophosphatase [Bdellovibrionales bacterium]|nr:RdgB/HAM1 family non-canonical purine NTP pyrophosphatase [Bdellovibrionales bacterium]